MASRDFTSTNPKTLFLTSGRHAPSSRYRVFQFLPYLRADGFSCRAANSFPEKYEYFRLLGWRGSRALKRSVRCWHLLQLLWNQPDIVVLEREIFDEPGLEFENMLRSRVRRLVLDVDDAIFLRYPEKFPQLARMCDGIIAGNSLLQEYFLRYNTRTTVIPTCVDLAKYPVSVRPRAPLPLVIGWIGTPTNLAELPVVLPALHRLSQVAPLRLRLITVRHPALEELDLRNLDWELIPWRPETAVDDLRQCDIGIMPLRTDEPWNRYKCGLKLIEYMAIGLPVVASPVGVNAEIVTHGVDGFHAETEDDWFRHLSRLTSDADLRQFLGGQARETVAARYSIAAWLPQLEQTLRAWAQ